MANRPTALRARDADRVETCGLLDTALGDGQLTDDEHRDRTRAAMSARTLADLDAVVSDLQLPAHTTVSRPTPARTVPVRRLVVGTAAAAAVAIAAVVTVSGTDDDESPPVAAPLVQAPAADAAADPYADISPIVVERVDPLTAAGIGTFRDAYLAKFGDTLVDRATFFAEYVSVDRMVTGEPHLSQDWTFRGGFGSSRSPDTGRDPDRPMFDLAEVNLDALAGHLAGAAESVHVPGGVIAHLDMKVYDDAPEVTIYVDNDAGLSGYLSVAPDGTPIDVSYGDQ